MQKMHVNSLCISICLLLFCAKTAYTIQPHHPLSGTSLSSTPKIQTTQPPVQHKQLPLLVQKQLVHFAQQKLQRASHNLRWNKQNMQLQHMGTSWRATYYEYPLNSISLRTKFLHKNRYIAYIRYARLTFETYGETKEKARTGTFTLAKRRWITEIARFENGCWK